MRLKVAAGSFHVTPKTAAKWVRRYQDGTYRTAGPLRPWHSPRATSAVLVAHVVALRREHRPAYQIAQATGLSPATVSRILQCAHLNRWRDLHPAPPVVRYDILIPAICCTSTSRE